MSLPESGRALLSLAFPRQRLRRFPTSASASTSTSTSTTKQLASAEIDPRKWSSTDARHPSLVRRPGTVLPRPPPAEPLAASGLPPKIIESLNHTTDFVPRPQLSIQKSFWPCIVPSLHAAALLHCCASQKNPPWRGKCSRNTAHPAANPAPGSLCQSLKPIHFDIIPQSVQDYQPRPRLA
jgi:hypothetical protein